jgi:hypothetical protein
LNAEEIEQLFTCALNPIPVDLDEDAAKAIVLETCKSALEMDIAQMKRGLEKWGFRIKDFERLTDPYPYPPTLQEYMVWVECHYAWDLAKTNFSNWLQGLPDFPWVGKWDFVVNAQVMNMATREFTVRVTRFLGYVHSLHGLPIRVPWPDRRREIIDTTRWQRR